MDVIDGAVGDIVFTLAGEQLSVVESEFGGQVGVFDGYALDKSALDADMDGADEAVEVDVVELTMSLVQSGGPQSDAEDGGVVEEVEEEL